MAYESANTFCTLIMFLSSLTAGGGTLTILGVLNENVLLSCHGSYSGAFRLSRLVVNWQRSENDLVVHSYFDGEDQPQYQESEFEGRTRLFPEEFSKGNASLLLTYLRPSDTGNYTCHYILNDDDHNIPQQVQLLVEDKTHSEKNPENPELLSCLLIIPVALIAPVICIVARKNRKNTISKGAHRLTRHIGSLYKINEINEIPEISKTSTDHSTENTPLLRKKETYDAIESYQNKVCGITISCCRSDSASSSSTEDEDDGCVTKRRMHTLNGRECLGTEYIFEDKETAVQSEDLFTLKTMTLISRRMLIVGDAGIGKSCFAKGLEKQWAFGKRDFCYKCVIYIAFSELNTFKKAISVKTLLEYKCPELSEVLPDLLDSDGVLVILDGLDELNHELKDNLPSGTCDIKTPFEVGTLVSKVITKKLLCNTDVLVTSRLYAIDKIRKYFSIFVMEEFNQAQINDYFRKFMDANALSNSFSDYFETKSILSSLVSIPLLSSSLCDVQPKVNYFQGPEVMSTFSRMMFFPLQMILRNTLAEEGVLFQSMDESKLPTNIGQTINQLCKLSYDNLISGTQELKTKDLAVNCSSTKSLFERISEYFFTVDNNRTRLKYRTTSMRDMFAALYWVKNIRDTELKECLDDWVFGENSKRFQGFLRFFIGLLPYENYSFLTTQPTLCKIRKDFLKGWFKTWIEQKPKKVHFSNFIHYVFELHDDDLTEDVSQCIKDINLFNIPLNSLNIKALAYCCQTSRLNEVDLQHCGLADEDLEQLVIIIRNCKRAMLTANKLTEKSGIILRNLLEERDCGIEILALDGNSLGTAGAKQLLNALENNRSLKKLSLIHNDIDEFCKERMVQSLKLNKTLEELHLCLNVFGDDDMKNITELKQDRAHLNIVLRISEDENVLRCVENKVDTIIGNEWNRNEAGWLHQVLKRIQEDLNNDEDIDQAHQDRVNTLKRKISRLLQQICSEMILGPNARMKILQRNSFQKQHLACKISAK